MNDHAGVKLLRILIHTGCELEDIYKNNAKGNREALNAFHGLNKLVQLGLGLAILGIRSLQKGLIHN